MDAAARRSGGRAIQGAIAEEIGDICGLVIPVFASLAILTDVRPTIDVISKSVHQNNNSL
jgi:hypothetical protein